MKGLTLIQTSLKQVGESKLNTTYLTIYMSSVKGGRQVIFGIRQQEDN